MVSKRILRRLDRLSKSLMPKEETGIFVIGRETDPVIVGGEEYSIEEFQRTFPELSFLFSG